MQFAHCVEALSGALDDDLKAGVFDGIMNSSDPDSAMALSRMLGMRHMAARRPGTGAGHHHPSDEWCLECVMRRKGDSEAKRKGLAALFANPDFLNGVTVGWQEAQLMTLATLNTNLQHPSMLEGMFPSSEAYRDFLLDCGVGPALGHLISLRKPLAADQDPQWPCVCYHALGVAAALCKREPRLILDPGTGAAERRRTWRAVRQTLTDGLCGTLVELLAGGRSHLEALKAAHLLRTMCDAAPATAAAALSALGPRAVRALGELLADGAFEGRVDAAVRAGVPHYVRVLSALGITGVYPSVSPATLTPDAVRRRGHRRAFAVRENVGVVLAAMGRADARSVARCPAAMPAMRHWLRLPYSARPGYEDVAISVCMMLRALLGDAVVAADMARDGELFRVLRRGVCVPNPWLGAHFVRCVATLVGGAAVLSRAERHQIRSVYLSGRDRFRDPDRESDDGPDPDYDMDEEEEVRATGPGGAEGPQGDADEAMSDGTDDPQPGQTAPEGPRRALVDAVLQDPVLCLALGTGCLAAATRRCPGPRCRGCWRSSGAGPPRCARCWARTPNSGCNAPRSSCTRTPWPRPWPGRSRICGRRPTAAPTTPPGEMRSWGRLRPSGTG